MRHTTKVIVLVAAVIGAFGLAATGWAFWTASGSGSASASVGTLTAPGKPAGTVASGSVSLNWSASTVSGGGVVKYHVERTANSGTSWSDACGSSAVAPISATSCSDAPAAGTYQYRVTAVYQSWTAMSALSDPITVVSGGATVSAVSSSSVNGTYGIGATIPITVTFSAPVTVTGTPQLALSTINPTTTAVNYTSGSGTNTLTFTYTVAAGNNTPDLNYASTTALALNGGTIKNTVGGSDAILTLPAPAAAGSLGSNKDIVIDGVAPVVTNVTSTLADGSYKVGQVVPVTVAFNDTVTVTGSPQLALNSGGTATYTSGTGTSTLTFNYTVVAGNTSADLDYATTISLGLNGGTIKDAAANPATLTLPTPTGTGSLGANKNLVIDTTAPTATVEQKASAPAQADPTKTLPVHFTATFSEPVNALAANGTGVALGGTANRTSATIAVTTTDSTHYDIAVSGLTSDGTITAALNGSATTDLAGNNSLASTSTDNTVTYDTTAPTAFSVSTSNGTGTAGLPETGDSTTLTFSEEIKTATVLAGWSGNATNIVVRATDGGSANDTLTFFNSANTTQLPLGSLDLGSKTYFTGNVTFGASGTASSMSAVTTAGKTVVTISFGTVSDATKTGQDGNSKSIVTWTPSSTVTDLAGNGLNATTLPVTGNIKQF